MLQRLGTGLASTQAPAFKPVLKLTSPGPQDVNMSGQTLSQGTVFIRWRHTGTPPAWQALFQASSGSNAHYITVYVSSQGNLRVLYRKSHINEVQEDFALTATLTSEAVSALVVRWDGVTGRLGLYVNGRLLRQYSGLNEISNSLQKIAVGQLTGGSTVLSDPIEHFAYYDIYVSDAFALTLSQQSTYNGAYDLIAADAGQSNATRKHSAFNGAGAVRYNATLDDHGRYRCYSFSAGLGGSAINALGHASHYWWDHIHDMPGPVYQNHFLPALDSDTAIAQRAWVGWIKWSQGEADADTLNATHYTKQRFKEDSLSVFKQMRKDIHAHLKILIEPLGIDTANINDYGAQAIREAQQELAAEQSWIYLGAEKYDLPLQDSVHLNQSGYEAIERRNAKRILSLEGTLSGADFQGPFIKSASYSAHQITVHIAHDGGTDFSPGADIQGFRVTDNGVDVEIVSAARMDPTSVLLTLASPIAPGRTIKLWYMYGAQNTVNQNLILRDNALEPLALRHAYAVNVVNAA